VTALSTSWLAARLGLDPLQIDRLRESGALLGVSNGREHHYPAWQFAENGRLRPAAVRLLGEARRLRVTPEAVVALLDRPVGLVGQQRFLDLLLDGHEERVLGELRQVAAA
jgi:hypothetical protein